MHTALWIAQVVLAAIFLTTGLIKLTQPRQKMVESFMTWAADVSDAQFRALGALEVLGALGLILPGILGVGSFVTPLAALGLGLTMVGAAVTHVRLGEAERLVVPVLLFAVALFAAIERFGPYSL